MASRTSPGYGAPIVHDGTRTCFRRVSMRRRVNFGHLEVDVTIDDPKAYSRPWKSDTMRFTLQPDTELLEHLCENNRDLPVLERYWRDREQKR